MTPDVPTTTRSPAAKAGESLEQQALGHAADLYRLACRLLGHVHDAEDVVQDAFVKALVELRRGNFRGEADLRTWLFRITTNVALDRLRRPRATAPPDEQAIAPGDPAAHLALKELSEAVAELPDDQRAALVLKELHGLSTRETSQVLERSEGATEQLLVRARQSLRRRFDYEV